MKNFKINSIWNVLIFLLGIGLVILGIISKNELALSFGALMSFIILIKMIRRILIFSNKEKREKYLVEANDERNKTITGKAGLVAYVVMEFSLFILYVYYIVTNNDAMLNPIAELMATGVLAYFISYLIFRKIN